MSKYDHRIKEDIGFSSRPNESDQADHCERSVDHLERARLREAEIDADPCNMIFVDAFDIPPHMVPEGWVYYWGRLNVNDAQDPDRIGDLQSQKWGFVPADRHPELAAKYRSIQFNGSMHQNYLYNKGLILMELPINVYNKRRIALREHNESQVNATPGAHLGIVATSRIDSRNTRFGI